MVKKVKLEPIGEETAIATHSNLLSALKNKNLKVAQVCGGRGLCATCHVYIREGTNCLSPKTLREQRTLSVIDSCKSNSRLACQTQVIEEGVTVELPSGMYVSEMENIEELIGRRAQEDILHPLSGKVLVEEGKLITRSMIEQLLNTQTQVSQYIYTTEEA